MRIRLFSAHFLLSPASGSRVIISLDIDKASYKIMGVKSLSGECDRREGGGAQMLKEYSYKI